MSYRIILTEENALLNYKPQWQENDWRELQIWIVERNDYVHETAHWVQCLWLMMINEHREQWGMKNGKVRIFGKSVYSKSRRKFALVWCMLVWFVSDCTWNIQADTWMDDAVVSIEGCDMIGEMSDLWGNNRLLWIRQTPHGSVKRNALKPLLVDVLYYRFLKDQIFGVSAHDGRCHLTLWRLKREWIIIYCHHHDRRVISLKTLH